MTRAATPDLPALPLQQSPACAAALARIGAEVSEVRLAHGRATVLSRRLGLRVRLVSRGPIWDPGAGAEDKIGDLGRLRRGGPLVVNAEDAEDAGALRAAGLRQVLTPAFVAELPIRTDPAEQRGALAGSWRNALRQGEARGLVLSNRPFKAGRDGWLLAAEAAQRRERRYRALPVGLVPALASAAPGDVRILTARARPGATPMAGIVVIRHGTTATYHIGWTGPEGRTARATHFLLWRAMSWLAGRGVTRLDLGTVDSGAAPGLMRFKLGTGAALRPLGGTWLSLFSRGS